MILEVTLIRGGQKEPWIALAEKEFVVWKLRRAKDTVSILPLFRRGIHA